MYEQKYTVTGIELIALVASLASPDTICILHTCPKNMEVDEITSRWQSMGIHVDNNRWQSMAIKKQKKFCSAISDINLTNWRQFFMHLSSYLSWISSSHCQRWIRRLRWQCYDEIHCNNRRDTLKTDMNLFFTITNCRISRSRSLTHRTNFKFLSLSAHWQ